MVGSFPVKNSRRKTRPSIFGMDDFADFCRCLSILMPQLLHFHWTCEDEKQNSKEEMTKKAQGIHDVS